HRKPARDPEDPARPADPDVPAAGNDHSRHRRPRASGDRSRYRLAADLAMSTTRIGVGGDRPYEVVVGRGLSAELPALIGEQARTVALIHSRGLDRLAAQVRAALAGAGYVVHAEAVPPGEEAKDIGVATALWSRLAAHQVSRSDAIVGLGGGAVTDLAGFVA